MARYLLAGSIGLPSYKKRIEKGSIGGHGEGIYTIKLGDDNKLSLIALNYCDNASTICLNKAKNVVYITNESRDFKGGKASGGGISAFKINQDKSLSLLNVSSSYGSRPAYSCLSEDEQFLVVANHGSHSSAVIKFVKNSKNEYELQNVYDDSSIAVFRLREDGSIGSLVDLKVFDHHGYWANGRGQTSSHLHCVRYNKGLFFALNRGADEIEVLKLSKNGEIDIVNIYKVHNGMAPRYIEFHPVLNIIYVLNENYPYLSVYEVNYQNGQLNLLQEIPTMDEEYYVRHPWVELSGDEAPIDLKCNNAIVDHEVMMPSDLHLGKNCEYLYLANRNFTTNAVITCFKVRDNGQVDFVGTNSLDGHDPRGFNILEDNSLAVGLLDQNMLIIYKLGKNGMFKDVIGKINIPSISCIQEI